MFIDDIELRTRLGQAARQSYQEGPFQPASVCKFFINLYETVLQQKEILTSMREYNNSI